MQDETKAREVIQADRVIAHDILRRWNGPESAQTLHDTLHGLRDEDDGFAGDLIQAFARHRAAFAAPPAVESKPVPMILYCPKCHEQHVDEPDERTPEWNNPPHRSHLCHACGCIWRPADVATEGVRSIKTAGDADTWGWDGASVKPTLHPSDREAIARVREALRVEMLDQTTTGKRKSYSDGYAQGICRAIQQIDAILALSGSLAPEGGEDARDGSATTVPIAVILPSLEGARATLEHFAKTLADSEPRKLPLAAAFAASEASRLAAAVMLLTPPSTEKGETK